MKLRLHNDTLRLRLSQGEVARLKETGRVENTLSFAPGQSLGYSIETAPSGAVTAAFEQGRIRVIVPSAETREWIDSDQTGIEGGAPGLHILIEKDFQCLHKPTPEDADAFPNPLR
jgi:hypothetical protein